MTPAAARDMSRALCGSVEARLLRSGDEGDEAKTVAYSSGERLPQRTGAAPVAPRAPHLIFYVSLVSLVPSLLIFYISLVSLVKKKKSSLLFNFLFFMSDTSDM